jgi:hypothetical protein
MKTAHYVIRRHKSYTPYTKDLKSNYFWRLCEDFYRVHDWDDSLEILPESINDTLLESNSPALIDAFLDAYCKAPKYYVHNFTHLDKSYQFYLMLNESRDIVLLFFIKVN